MKLTLLCLFAIASAGISVAQGTCVRFPITQAPSVDSSWNALPNCIERRVLAFALLLTNSDIDVPECNADSTYVTKQFHAAKNESFCVSPRGVEYEDTRVDGPDADCTAYEGGVTVLPGPCGKYQAKLAESNPYNMTVNCTDDGFFAPKQHWEDWTYCTLHNGDLVPKTLVKNQQVECQVHYDMDYDESQCTSGDALIRYPGATNQHCDRYLNCAQGFHYLCACSGGQLFDEGEQACVEPRADLCT